MLVAIAFVIVGGIVGYLADRPASPQKPVAETVAPVIELAPPAPLTEEQKQAAAFDHELQIAAWHMPLEIRAELIDQPTLAYGAGAYGAVAPLANGHYKDPHDDPIWHHTRRECAHEHCCCMVKGCKDDPKGDAIHHGIAANACIKAGHYELAVRPGPGQKFYRLCEHHHSTIGHGIGYGGSWTKFNLDIEADVNAGRWNSRGRSEWKFMSEAEVVAWVKAKVNAAKESVQ